MDFLFFGQSILLGFGLAMDAFAVSMTNGLKENKMNLAKTIFISFMFGLFQALMPLLGYFIGHAFIDRIEKFIPYIALVLLTFLGVKMLFEVFKEKSDLKKGKINENKEDKIKHITFSVIMIQALATSIDALSVGLTIADYKLLEAIVCALIIALVTFIICVSGHFIGKKFGDKLGYNAQIAGGIILILIGLEIFIRGILHL